MHLDLRHIAALTGRVRVEGWLRIMPARHSITALGAALSASRWSSPSGAFKVIYIAEDLETALAETVIRDRFEAVPTAGRIISLSEITGKAIAEIDSKRGLNVLDLTRTGPLKLGISTDAVGAKAHKEGQVFSEKLHYTASAVDGILFESRLTGGWCIAVYERGIGKLSAGPAISLERARGLVTSLDALDITIDDDLT